VPGSGIVTLIQCFVARVFARGRVVLDDCIDFGAEEQYHRRNIRIEQQHNYCADTAVRRIEVGDVAHVIAEHERGGNPHEYGDERAGRDEAKPLFNVRRGTIDDSDRQGEQENHNRPPQPARPQGGERGIRAELVYQPSHRLRASERDCGRKQHDRSNRQCVQNRDRIVAPERAAFPDAINDIQRMHCRAKSGRRSP
jgi:hypothetical protein